MTTLEFISSLVSSLAWPSVVMGLVLVFRRSIIDLLSRQVSRLKAGPVEMEWDKAVVEIQAEVEPAEELRAREARTLPVGGVLLDDIAPLAYRAPAAAILEAHGRVESALRRRLGGVGVDAENVRSFHQVVRLAEQHALITAEDARALEGISTLRNLAAHRQDDVTTDKALEFLALAEAVLYSVSTWATTDNPDA